MPTEMHSGEEKRSGRPHIMIALTIRELKISFEADRGPAGLPEKLLACFAPVQMLKK
jgi:hypothetical protein